MSAREDPEQLVRNVGRRVVELRTQRKWTQEMLAEKLGTSVQYVSRIEAGENHTIHSLAKIANVFGVTLVALFDEPGPIANPEKRGRPRKR